MSAPEATATATATRRDELFRTLYLRREAGILTARGRAALAAEATPAAEADASPESHRGSSSGHHNHSHSGADDMDWLQEVLLLPPPSAVASTTLEGCWRGLVHVRHRPSPWYGAIFQFLVHFPPRYPFECPTVYFTSRLRSHPLLTRAAGGPPGAAATTPLLEEFYCAADPMRSSVMALVLRHVHALFYPHAWPARWAGSAPSINRMMARRDVTRHSLHALGAAVSRTYRDVLEDTVAVELLAQFEQQREAAARESGDAKDDSDAVVARWAEWYGRVLHPLLLATP